MLVMLVCSVHYFECCIAVSSYTVYFYVECHTAEWPYPEFFMLSVFMSVEMLSVFMSVEMLNAFYSERRCIECRGPRKNI